MPLTQAQIEAEIAKLNALTTRQNEALRRLTERIEALEKQGTGKQLERLIEAANQAGAMFAGLAQNQTVVKTPAKKWEPV
jgi:hypothetical protein